MLTGWYFARASGSFWLSAVVLSGGESLVDSAPKTRRRPPDKMPIPVVANNLRRLIRLILPVLSTMELPMFCDSRRISSIYLAENLDRRVAVHPLGELVEQEAVKNSMFLGPKGCVGSRGDRFLPWAY
jgi:hypothetical protein